MEEILPLDTKDFDYIVLGTGLTESLVSAALARIGKTVLHLDENGYYGASSGSLSLDSLNDLLRGVVERSLVEKEALAPFEWQESTPINKLGPKDIRSVARASIPARPEGAVDLTKDNYVCRRCSIDLNPKVIWSRSLVIDTLIRAGASRYLEFKTVQHLYMHTKSKSEKSSSSASSSANASSASSNTSISTPTLTRVPVSKADVFNTKDISLIEKRQLMKFITTISQPDETETALLAKYADKPFIEYIKVEKKIGDNLAQFLLYAIALESHNHQSSPVALITRDGVASVLRFMGSLGRYGGNSPWIYPLFGLGDLCQSFCRLSAVYGATFILGWRASEFNMKLPSDPSEKPVITSIHVGATKNLTCKHLITNVDHIPELVEPLDNSSASSSSQDPVRSLSRCVLITDRPLKTKEGTREILLNVLPPGSYNNANAVYMFQLDESASVVPAEKYLIQIWTEGTPGRTAQEDLEPIVSAFTTNPSDDPIEAFAAGIPNIFYVAYFSHVQRKIRKDVTLPSNLTIVNDIDFDIGADSFFSSAQRIFEELCPGEEFIPIVPNPEDIIWGGEDGDGEAAGAEVAEIPNFEPTQN